MPDRLSPPCSEEAGEEEERGAAGLGDYAGPVAGYFYFVENVGVAVVEEGGAQDERVDVCYAGVEGEAGAVFAANTQSLVFELGTISDRVNLTTGQFGIGIGTLEFDDFAFTAGSGFGPGTYTLFDSSVAVFGNLGTSLSGTIDGYTATLALGDTNNDIILNVVPEPGSAALLLGGLAMLASRRKRR